MIETKKSYIKSWEAEHYLLPEDLKNTMLAGLSFGGIIAKLADMAAWQEVGGLWSP